MSASVLAFEEVMKLRSLRFIMIAAISGLLAFPMCAEETKPRVLILSGANNHDWKSTTPAIRSALEESGRFVVDVEENVFAMKAESFAPYAVVLSNFNTYGKDAPKGGWSAETKKAFSDHIAKGRGLVIVHAGSSVFYDWPEFQNLACGTWKGGTNHGAIHVNRVTFNDGESPITQGLAPFWIRDEFWQNTAVAPGAKALASVTPDPAFKGSGKPENIVFSTESGGGRGFAIFLGHDAGAMGNPAWRTLLQRGTEWAATGKVTIPPARKWPATREDALQAGYSWMRNETSLALCKDGKTIWKLVAEVRHFPIGRPNAAGQYAIDWTSVFTVGDAPVKLDRSPPANQPKGVSYGGYAGLSLRFPPGLKGWSFRTSEGANSAADGNGKTARWTDLSGPAAGIAVFDHPANIRHPSPWYLFEGPPLLYFSPAVLFDEPLEKSPLIRL